MSKKLGIIVFVGCIILGLIIGTLAYSRIKKDGQTESNTESESQSAESIMKTESVELEIIDADAYYEQNATVISVVDAITSDEMQTEQKIIGDLENRGFSQVPVYTNYDMDGTFHEETEIGESSSDKHPKYQAYYVTENEEVWTLIWINGKIMANPVSYNMQSMLPVQLVISETETINGYDNHTGKFYETIPNDSALIVKVVKSIDKDLLERLTIEEIDKL